MLTEKDLLIKLELKIKELQEKAGLTQEELAFISNLHRTYIGMIERAEKNITITTLFKISNALGVSIKEIMQDFDDKPKGKVSLLKTLRG
jgi:transcriptional regulator with XRE-family HTH domain